MSLPDDLPVCVSEGGLKVEPLASMRSGQPTASLAEVQVQHTKALQVSS